MVISFSSINNINMQRNWMFFAAFLLLAQACANDPAPSAADKPTDEAPVAAPQTPVMGVTEAQSILADAVSAQADFKKVLDQVMAVPPSVQKAHADEYANMQSTIEGIYEKHGALTAEAQSALATTSTNTGKPSGDAAAPSLSDLQLEAVKQCAEQTTEYKKAVVEIRAQMAKW
jgi:hypothetical protein